MLNNVEHFAFVHNSISHTVFGEISWIHSVVVVLIIEGMIILFAVNGKEEYVYIFTLCLFVLQLIYYPLDSYWNDAEYGKLIAAVIFSFLFTFSIYYYAKLIADEIKDTLEVSNLTTQLSETRVSLANKLIEFNDFISKALVKDKKLDDLQYKYDALLEEKNNHTCASCGQWFNSIASRNHHTPRCSKINEGL